MVQEIQLRSVGIDSLKKMYKDDKDLKEIYEVYAQFFDSYHANFPEFLLQQGLLFKGSQFCVPKCSMKENIIKEKHSGSLGGHFALDKTLEQVKRFYFFAKVTIKCQEVS